METPCDYLKDENGLSYCPYEDYGGSDRCRVCCGLGVDEDNAEEEKAMAKKILLFDIEWDTDGEELDLPVEVVMKDEDAEEYINDPEGLGRYDGELADYLSDEYGFCVKSFNACIMTIEPGRKCSNCKNRCWSSWSGIDYCMWYEMTTNEYEEVKEAAMCGKYEKGTPDCLMDDEYCPSATGGDYSPSSPWNAPGMSVKDFI